MAQSDVEQSTASAATEAHDEAHQEHPISLYLKVWGLLFVLSFFSYMVDFYQLEGFWQWFLILTFMVLKAGVIIAVFMHMMWERMALITAITVPPLVILLLVFFLAVEGSYITSLRQMWFGH